MAVIANRKQKTENRKGIPVACRLSPVNHARGFALLIAVIFMAVALSLGLALASLAYKQEVLASAALESQSAFYAADAGLECALRADQQENSFAYSTYNPSAPSFSETCGGKQHVVSTACYNSAVNGCSNQWVMSWTVPLAFSDPVNQPAGSEKACAVVTIYKPAPAAGSSGGFDASGGNITTAGGYTIHTFTSNGTFTPNQAGNVEVLVVGGGGGGGSGNNTQCVMGGGGGAGGVVYQSSQPVNAQSYTITVGAGGAGGWNGALNSGLAGGTSSFDTLSASGGGGGGYGNCSGAGGTGLAGASGGGGGWGTNGTGAQSGGAGVSGQGHNGAASQSGGASGGGGGAGGAASGSYGGVGAANSISGSSAVYGAGGQGNTNGLTSGVTSPAAAANSGNGGAGGWSASGGSGGSGVVIVRYPTPASGGSNSTTYIFSQGYDVACSSITQPGIRFASRGLSASYSD